MGGVMALPGCPNKCGDVAIPYPFGIGENCTATSLNSYFNLICSSTFHPPRPQIWEPEAYIEATDISLERGEMCVLRPVSHICFTSNTTSTKSSIVRYNLKRTPFLPSSSRSRFTVIGCNTLGLISGYGTAPSHKVWAFNPCFYSIVADVGWYSFKQKDLIGHLGFIKDRAQNGAPIIADWAIRNGSCREGKETPSGYACASANSYCTAVSNDPGYLCNCSEGYTRAILIFQMAAKV
ncbi:hypothetical protein E2562_037930 [Oryza meyeriana var. granulata]|uniref:Wall-associated receptor kinase galacturonan-binding domain-containing protein n=1 Tax=Oryza meyeriana var. granulata TaxID=110450 RepID=A0A6G1BQ18_9ORYZ|nr:hypothetical protein E2562_037930 [Oryza meyeriana var. granulata]